MAAAVAPGLPALATRQSEESSCMIISRLDGGLGNQMFQYAYGLYAARRNHTQLWLDLGSYASKPQHGFLLDRLQIEAEHDPSSPVLRRFVTITDDRIDTFLRFLFLPLADGRRDDDPVSPNDRARPTPPGDLGSPDDVLGGAPAVGEPGCLRHPCRTRPAELGPVLLSVCCT